MMAFPRRPQRRAPQNRRWLSWARRRCEPNDRPPLRRLVPAFRSAGTTERTVPGAPAAGERAAEQNAPNAMRHPHGENDASKERVMAETSSPGR